MIVNRRRFFAAAALTGMVVEGQNVDAARNVSAAHGVALSDERLRVLRAVLARRPAQLQMLRSFVVDDSVEPTHGCR